MVSTEIAECRCPSASKGCADNLVRGVHCWTRLEHCWKVSIQRKKCYRYIMDGYDKFLNPVVFYFLDITNWKSLNAIANTLLQREKSNKHKIPISERSPPLIFENHVDTLTHPRPLAPQAATRRTAHDLSKSFHLHTNSVSEASGKSAESECNIYTIYIRGVRSSSHVSRYPYTFQHSVAYVL